MPEEGRNWPAFVAGAEAPKETAVNSGKDIVLVVDYHLQNLQIRRFDQSTGEERCFRRQTTRQEILRVVREAQVDACAAGGKVVWIMESTTGWARVKDLVGQQAEFLLANVLQMPLPPKAKRRKTDKIDTARMLREYSNGSLPLAYQPVAELRRVRRLVDCRQDLIRRQTALKNWVSHFLSHETWYGTSNLWSARGLANLKKLALAPEDRWLLDLKVAELEQVQQLLEQVEEKILEVYDGWGDAQRLDEVHGIAPISAVTILAYIGPIRRFAGAEELISYAGLAPGGHWSDQRGYGLRCGGGGTHSQLRFFVMQATRWLKEIPRYAEAFSRMEARRGKKVARLVVGRMFLRSLDKMLRTGQRFVPEVAAA
jgi:transposase